MSPRRLEVPVKLNAERFLYAIAERFGITVLHGKLGQIQGLGCAPHWWSTGPQGHAISLSLGIALFDPAPTSRQARGVERKFHEMAHLVMHPPGYDIEHIEEEWVLMPWERAVARALGKAEVLEAVIGYQEDTMISYDNLTATEQASRKRYLGDLKRYTERKFWRDGIKRCQTLGVLDADGRPTWKLPNWSLLSEDEGPGINHRIEEQIVSFWASRPEHRNKIAVEGIS